jgi:hypothetical protein
MMVAAAALFSGGMNSYVPPVTADAGPAPVIAPPFRDVPPGHWAAGAVEKLRRAGIVIGYSLGPLPDATPLIPLTKKRATDGPFSDVPTD